ncbi:RNA-directed DNA polymerase, eukaryota, Reverse transcriptase zinc-binding domain protein [Artemisia annua]|uniref:RNA-directed DNA polymerase, eukaryota, Reverse transcriptase zinc-binding domain protein n=1 Tax=Artemisia annua TaxID=35608 RepID=A0A2U1N683_ARTAN|nr:RNA-directed DNA polymerase, eukaryota, Reverse transcriptase zinc-binding domain protein [Artemisia annua]
MEKVDRGPSMAAKANSQGSNAIQAAITPVIGLSDVPLGSNVNQQASAMQAAIGSVTKDANVSDRAPQPTVNTTSHDHLANGTLIPSGMHFPRAWARSIRSATKNQEINELVTLLTNLCLSNDHDCWEYTISDNRMFIVKSMRSHITKFLHPVNPQPFRWNKSLPSKINIPSWRILHKRLPTIFNLDLRGIDLDITQCLVCDEDIDMEEHLFTSCSIYMVENSGSQRQLDPSMYCPREIELEVIPHATPAKIMYTKKHR